MNKTELAIEHFSYGISHDIYSEPVTTYAKLAVEALREKQEREKGCEYCNTGESLNGYEDVGSFIILPKGKKYYLEITFNRDFYNCTTDINYCPMCGKRLEVEP